MYGTEGRGPSIAYEGQSFSLYAYLKYADVSRGYKSSTHTHLNYIVIVSPPSAPSAASHSATLRNFVARQPQVPDRSDVSKVTVFDIENKFVAYSGVFVNGVRAVFSEWDNIYVLTNGGEVRIASFTESYVSLKPFASLHVSRRSRLPSNSTCSIAGTSTVLL